MLSEKDWEPDQCGAVIYVGQDKAGHWLVQDDGKRLEARFVSRTAAMSFAKGECQMYHASLEMAGAPLIPMVSVGPVFFPNSTLCDAA